MSARNMVRFVATTRSGRMLSRSATESAPFAATSTQLLPPPPQAEARCQMPSVIFIPSHKSCAMDLMSFCDSSGESAELSIKSSSER